MLLRQLHKKLPDNVSYPRISINNSTNDFFFCSYNILSDLDASEIEKFIENNIRPRLGAIKGIERIEIFGIKQLEYVLVYDLTKFKTLGISTSSVVSSLHSFFDQKNIGVIIANNQANRLVITPKKVSNLFNVKTPIALDKNRIVYLKDVVDIKLREKSTKKYYRINGKNTVSINLAANKNANTIQLSD
jgi:multidrug efflux pump subunit AcrB